MMNMCLSCVYIYMCFEGKVSFSRLKINAFQDMGQYSATIVFTRKYLVILDVPLPKFWSFNLNPITTHRKIPRFL